MRKLISFALLLTLCIGKNVESQDRLTSSLKDTGMLLSDKLDKVIAQSPLLTLHRWLCEIPSVTYNEEPIALALANYFKAHDFTVELQEVKGASNKTRYNVYAAPPPKKSKSENTPNDIESDAVTKKIASPKVLLTSHIDTVPPHIPYSLSLPEKGKHASRRGVLISGRGTVDAKACVAVQIQTVLDLLADPKTDIDPADLALLFVVGEERGGDGMRHFSDSDLYEKTNKNYKAILFGEPTEGKLASGHKGIGMLLITANGKAAHSGYPWLGRSANSMLVPALMALNALGDLPEAEGGLPRSEKYGKSTVNLGLMTGGVAANVVAEYAHAEVSWRLAGGDDAKAVAIVKNALKGADPEGRLELEFIKGYGPVPLDHDVPGFESMTVNYGTDIPNLKVAEGVKRYLYGPGTITVAHAVNEGLTVGDLEDAVEGYKRLVKHALDL